MPPRNRHRYQPVISDALEDGEGVSLCRAASISPPPPPPQSSTTRSQLTFKNHNSSGSSSRMKIDPHGSFSSNREIKSYHSQSSSFFCLFTGEIRTFDLPQILSVPATAASSSPTNHLDLRAVLWLKEYLSRRKNTLVVVSHDRHFLNFVCGGEIIHLHDHKLHFYKGNYDGFEIGHEQNRKETNEKFETFDKQMKAAKRTRRKTKLIQLKDRAKFVAAKEASKKFPDSFEEDNYALLRERNGELDD